MVMFSLLLSQHLSNLLFLSLKHSNLFEVDILGLADLAGDIFIYEERHLMCIEIVLLASYQL